MAVQGRSAAEPPSSAGAAEGLQPFLHDACTTVYAPSLALSRRSGDLAGGADGFFHGDRRALSRLEVRFETDADGGGNADTDGDAGAVPVLLAPLGHTLRAADETGYRAVLRGVGEVTADPAVTLHRVRRLTPGRLRETLRITNSGALRVSLTMVVAAGTDLARMDDVKSGRFPRPWPAAAASAEHFGPHDPGGRGDSGTSGGTGAPDSVETAADDADAAATGLIWQDEDGLRVVLRPLTGPAGASADAGAAADADADGTDPDPGAAPATLAGAPAVRPEDGELRYRVALAPGASWQAVLECTVHDPLPAPFPAPAPGSVDWPHPRLASADQRLDRLVARSVGDLERLLLTDPDHPGDTFLAAGSPWFLTLFGRDSLWAARMLLPLGTELAAGTLRTLARRQGTRVDPHTEEQPGKILHEVRREPLRLADSRALPAVYYGTVDATPLWITLLHDAWRWGMPAAEVAELLPHAEAGLEWLARYGDADGDGLLEYVDSTGSGLANQGWKDSGDSIRWRDGRLAAPPIALCEVQAYAYEAALAGAALLRAFDRPGADRWEEWAATVRRRFRESFWVSDALGRYPAVALDVDKRPVDSATSAFGHLLGTGLLDHEESALLADRLAGPDLDCGFGVRTLSSRNAGFNPLGYHVGSVWPHDTAIAVHGLVRAGFPAQAVPLAKGIVAASVGFEARLPELYGGHGSGYDEAPAPYPAACRPQAWSAAAGVLLLQAALGLSADVPGGRLRIDPAAAGAFGPLHVSGLRVAGAPLSVRLDADGRAEVTAPDSLTLEGAHRAAPRS
ncbi:glycogen debranching N-terminal domain-containing protein [Streptomyces sp. NPDC087270]|uniref:glycogen debranching N-terminal domain-containing protein n=1 Tax=Streptomyces sp. NPDC087270 TaxID=3365774 RepID=UPI0038209DA5